jgi:hypothetical protein
LVSAPIDRSRLEDDVRGVQKIEIFEIREKGSKTASLERRRNGSILQNGAYDSGG